MTINKLVDLVEFLQDNTSLAEMLESYGVSDEATSGNPKGDYARIENWLVNEIDEDLEF